MPRYHYVFDISSIRDDLSDTIVLDRILHELTSVMDSTILAGPLIAEGHPDNPGFTGFVVVDYSHIPIHTFTRHQEALIDIFSCKPYDKFLVQRYIQQHCATEKSVFREKQVWWGT